MVHSKVTGISLREGLPVTNFLIVSQRLVTLTFFRYYLIYVRVAFAATHPREPFPFPPPSNLNHIPLLTNDDIGISLVALVESATLFATMDTRLYIDIPSLYESCAATSRPGLVPCPQIQPYIRSLLKVELSFDAWDESIE